MLPALGLFRPKGRDLQGRGAFLDTGFPNTFWSECYRAPCFFSYGAHHLPTFQVMRRRLQGTKHTDCTARRIFGRRNRYALTAPMVTGTPFFDLSSRKIADVSQLAEINQYAPSAVQFGAAEVCNSVLYFLPIRSIMELLAVKNRTLNDPKFRLRRVVPFSSVGFAPTDFCHTHGSHSWGSADRDFDSRSGVRAFLFHVT